MAIKDWPGGVITDIPVEPSGNYEDSAASGVWTLDQVANYVKQDLWPTPGNIDPSKYVEGVFSTYLYTGNGSTQTITNGIDLAGEGGLVWLKARSFIQANYLLDTSRGTKTLSSNTTDSENSGVNFDYTGFSFNADGFSLPSAINSNSQTYASWTFRKAEKFFDVVTYTGNGVAGRTVSHNLGSVPACIIVKLTSGSGGWIVYHVGTDATNPEQKYLQLNSTNAVADQTWPWNDTAPTDTEFTVGTGGNINGNGDTYVAYLFASDAGGFGDDGSESIIKCGSYTADSSNNYHVDVGFEPQWVMIKKTSGTGDWEMLDVMRGFTADASAGQFLEANNSNAEFNDYGAYLTSTGFVGSNQSGANGATYIYIAIRRPMKTPESGTEVFDLGENRTSIGNQTIGTLGAIDMCMSTQVPTPFTNYHWAFTNRLVGGDKFLASAYTQAEATAYQAYDTNTGVINGSWFTNGGLWYNFKRATGFFDVVAYTGTGVARTVAHNLGVAPELMIVKRRDTTGAWVTYWQSLGATKYQVISTASAGTLSTVWNNTSPTSGVFTVGTDPSLNANTGTYIAYLFATLAGVSKVGSYTGTGSNVNVDCGFSAGARFILIKRADSTGDWYVWDSVRGIVAGNDPYLLLNSTAAEVTTTDYIDPLASGFTVTSSAPAALNASGGTYIFLAIA